MVFAQTCDNNAVCTATSNGFACICNSGYIGSSVGCVNINECNVSSTCNDAETCNDFDGGFNCTCGIISVTCESSSQCLNTTGTPACFCRPGYMTDGPTCLDIDECSNTSISNCDPNAMCNNTAGSFACTCSPGYSGNGVNCTDIDECVAGTHNCTSPYTCKNIGGAFRCDCGADLGCDDNAQCIVLGNQTSCRCNAGYTGNGTQCTDIDECSGTNSCDLNADCQNTIGSYTCTCKEGYTGDGFDCFNGASNIRAPHKLVSLAVLLIPVYIYSNCL